MDSQDVVLKQDCQEAIDRAYQGTSSSLPISNNRQVEQDEDAKHEEEARQAKLATEAQQARKNDGSKSEAASPPPSLPKKQEQPANQANPASKQQEAAAAGLSLQKNQSSLPAASQDEDDYGAEESLGVPMPSEKEPKLAQSQPVHKELDDYGDEQPHTQKPPHVSSQQRPEEQPVLLMRGEQARSWNSEGQEEECEYEETVEYERQERHNLKMASLESEIKNLQRSIANMEEEDSQIPKVMAQTAEDEQVIQIFLKCYDDYIEAKKEATAFNQDYEDLQLELTQKLSSVEDGLVDALEKVVPYNSEIAELEKEIEQCRDQVEVLEKNKIADSENLELKSKELEAKMNEAANTKEEQAKLVEQWKEQAAAVKLAVSAKEHQKEDQIEEIARISRLISKFEALKSSKVVSIKSLSQQVKEDLSKACGEVHVETRDQLMEFLLKCQTYRSMSINTLKELNSMRETEVKLNFDISELRQQCETNLKPEISKQEEQILVLSENADQVPSLEEASIKLQYVENEVANTSKKLNSVAQKLSKANEESGQIGLAAQQTRTLFDSEIEEYKQSTDHPIEKTDGYINRVKEQMAREKAYLENLSQLQEELEAHQQAEADMQKNQAEQAQKQEAITRAEEVVKRTSQAVDLIEGNLEKVRADVSELKLQKESFWLVMAIAAFLKSIMNSIFGVTSS